MTAISPKGRSYFYGIVFVCCFAFCTAFLTQSASVPRVHNERTVDFSNNQSPESVVVKDAHSLPMNEVGGEFHFDKSRLYDISYEQDSNLVAIAQSIGTTSGCLIEIIKSDQENQSGTRKNKRPRCIQSIENRFESETYRQALMVLPGSYISDCTIVESSKICRRILAALHPYEQYANSELESLAVSSPEAAVILARRLEDPAESETYYEHAVALSGKPGPLVEWATHRNVGGIEYVNGELDIAKAKLGLEIYLTTAALGQGKEVAAEFKRVLDEARVDTGAIQQLAIDRINRLKNQRLILVGRPWENES